MRPLTERNWNVIDHLLIFIAKLMSQILILALCAFNRDRGAGGGGGGVVRGGMILPLFVADAVSYSVSTLKGYQILLNYQNCRKNLITKSQAIAFPNFQFSKFFGANPLGPPPPPPTLNFAPRSMLNNLIRLKLRVNSAMHRIVIFY